MAAPGGIDSSPVTTTTGGQAGGGGEGGGITAQEKALLDVSTAEQIAANLAAIGYTNSPLLGEAQPTIIVTPESNQTLLIVLLIGAGIVAFILLRRKSKRQ